MTKAIFITARTSSTRLPNKALLSISDKPSIQYLIEGLKSSVAADKIILCTSNEPEDDRLSDVARSVGIDCFRGSLEDKLVRWHGACEQYEVDFFVNADGDDLFFDPGLADHIFLQYSTKKCDFIDGHGLYNDAYGITKAALTEVCLTKNTDSTEYIRPYFLNPKFDVQKLINIPKKYLKNDVRLTLDYLDDLKFFETVITGMQNKNMAISFDNLQKYLKEEPHVKNINFYLENAWKENQKKLWNI
jgi:spore coat polysaccharide biosynthesis protein SpsF